MNLLPENASQMPPFLPKSLYRIYATTLQYLSSYGCTITVVYYIYIGISISSAHYIGIIKYIQYIYKLAYIVKCGSAHSGVRHTTVSKDPTDVWKTIQQRYQFIYCIQ